MTKRAALYLRVSTDGQTTDNQRLELERVAAQRGWSIAAVYDDDGVSGAKGREYRKQFDTMIKAATKGEFDLVAAWSVDRLGRSLQDLIGFLNELNAVGCDLYLHQQALDTTTPSGRAMFAMCGVFAEFERAMIQDRVKAGLQRARANGKRLGRPVVATDRVREKVMAARADGMSMRAIAGKVGVGVGTVHAVLKSA